MTYRPFVTFPNGELTILRENVRCMADIDGVMKRVSAVVEQQLGTQVYAMSPEQRGSFAARVEFFRVAVG